MGFGKLVHEIDDREAARAGLMGLHSKELNHANIEAHLQNFGLSPEFGTHSAIRGLSGGQVSDTPAMCQDSCGFLLKTTHGVLNI